MERELVSVVIPVYNCEEYLQKCVDSVLCQTYESLELILVDDGSPDKSGEICDEYGQKDSRVRVYHGENQGECAAREKGMHLASGRYLAFIDSDDYVDPDYLEVLMKRMLETGADMVCGNCVEEGQALWKNRRIESDASLTTFEDMLEEYFQKKRFAHVAWGKVFRKEILEQAVFSRQRHAGDTYMMLSCFRVCSHVELLTEAGYHYVIRPGGVSVEGKAAYVCRDRIQVLSYLLKVCENTSISTRKKAQKEYENGLYAMVSAFCQYTEGAEFQAFVADYGQYYRLVKGETKLHKRLVLFLFPKFSNQEKTLFSCYHRFIK